MNNVIIVPTYLDSIDKPVIFLAGPIQGADDWQSKAIDLITEESSDVYVASPRRKVRSKGDFTMDMYNEQVDWETFHLRAAGNGGTVMFWLANEAEHSCNRAYAQTSRFELSEWKMKHEFYGSNLVVGIDDNFTGSKYILRRMSQDCPEVPICSSLEDTCREAVRLSLFK